MIFILKIKGRVTQSILSSYHCANYDHVVLNYEFYPRVLPKANIYK